MISRITRQIVLDTETTGMNKFGAPHKGHRIIEIGAVEIIHRIFTGRKFHVYIQPDQPIDPEAYQIHGISDEFLSDKPKFHNIADEFLEFIRGGELIIHNASFDIGFIEKEFRIIHKNFPKLEKLCTITDSLAVARSIFPGKRNNLDALCRRYKIDNMNRILHGALLDAELLAEIYLAMTSSQTSMFFQRERINKNICRHHHVRISKNIKVISASESEIVAHEAYLSFILQKSGICLWNHE